jgi:hypothetical protein
MLFLSLDAYPSLTSLNDWGTHKKNLGLFFLFHFLKKKGEKKKNLDLIFFLFFSLKISKSYCLAGDVFCQINPKAP